MAEIVVVDTGSQDNTFEVLQASGLVDRLERFHGCNEGASATGKIEDFSLARAYSFGLATQPWRFWVDGDDVVVGAENLAAICERYASTDGPITVMFPYEYSHDHNGNVTCLHYRERLVRGGGGSFRWMGPVHEVLVPQGPSAMVNENSVRIIHKRAGKTEEQGRNLRILEKWLAKHGDDADTRMLYYTGLEYANAGNLAKSIEYHQKYVAKSGWDDEKCLSCLELSRHHLSMGNLQDAEDWALRASAVAESWREPLFALGRIFYLRAQKSAVRRDWERAANYFRRGLAMPPTQTMLFVNPMEARYEVHLYHTVALANIGAIHEALASCEAALEAVPGDANTLHNKHFYQCHLAKNQVLASVAQLEELGRIRADYGINEQAAFMIRNILAGRFTATKNSDATPAEEAALVQREPASVQVLQPGKLDIVLVTGAAWERWNPETLAKGGMGGSETMAWELTRRLAKQGHRVRVFGDCNGMEGTFEGVSWIDHSRFLDANANGGTKCDVLISSRIAEVADLPFEARARVAWVHDVHMGPSLTNKRALKFDRFLCLSEWHKQFFLDTYKYVHPASVVVTRNGIDLSRYKGVEVRDPHRMIYSSSPDRGLQVALQIMPNVRARVPDASLHVFYGFENWEKSPDVNERNRAEAMKGLIKAYEPFGVVFHGRVPGAELAREQLRSGVWSYPTWFSETSCLTAMEAQAAGLRIVTSPIAALNETVGEYGYLISGDWLSPAYQHVFTEHVVAALLHPESEQGDPRMDRHRQMNRATSFGLDSLAVEWGEMLTRFVVEVERDVVPQYRAAE